MKCGCKSCYEIFDYDDVIKGETIIVDLNKSNPLSTGGKRLAEVIEIHKYFVVCRSIKGGYRECVNV